MTFEEAAFKARSFAVAQGFSDIFLELEDGDRDENGTWHLHFTQQLSPLSKPIYLDVAVDDASKTIVSFKRRRE